jgi:aldehyde dehydrogenase (NAD+)
VLKYVPMTTDSIQNLTNQRKFFATHATLPLNFRLEQLKKLETAIIKYNDEILAALYADLKKPKMEAFTSEIAFAIDEIRLMQKKLSGWMQPQSVKTPIHLQPAKSEIYRDPLGVVLIIGPWNYPFLLAITPLMGAIAAGNCAIIKPSEFAPHTAELIKKIIAECFSPSHVCVIEGGVAETTELLKLKFDHIFFTGSTPVGKIVMKAAAETLTPVTLELGGKSPTIVSPNADLDLAARRIAWGKFLNAGQTCVAPDYVYVHERVSKDLEKKLQEQIKKFYTEDAKSSDSYARIINEKNFDRLCKLLNKEQVVYGGGSDRSSLYIEPTILNNVQWTDETMKDEIFGPILPLLKYQSLDEVFKTINSQPKPLAAYFFSQNENEVERFLTEVSFGGGCINDIIIHLANPHLPFGGVGSSGVGAYHGERSFLTFTHEKSVVRKSKWLDFDFRYPPYQAKHLKWIQKVFGIS